MQELRFSQHMPPGVGNSQRSLTHIHEARRGAGGPRYARPVASPEPRLVRALPSGGAAVRWLGPLEVAGPSRHGTLRAKSRQISVRRVQYATRWYSRSTVYSTIKVVRTYRLHRTDSVRRLYGLKYGKHKNDTPTPDTRDTTHATTHTVISHPPHTVPHSHKAPHRHAPGRQKAGRRRHTHGGVSTDSQAHETPGGPRRVVGHERHPGDTRHTYIPYASTSTRTRVARFRTILGIPIRGFVQECTRGILPPPPPSPSPACYHTTTPDAAVTLAAEQRGGSRGSLRRNRPARRLTATRSLHPRRCIRPPRDCLLHLATRVLPPHRRLHEPRRRKLLGLLRV
jgi:hypothetical protein